MAAVVVVVVAVDVAVVGAVVLVVVALVVVVAVVVVDVITVVEAVVVILVVVVVVVLVVVVVVNDRDLNETCSPRMSEHEKDTAANSDRNDVITVSTMATNLARAVDQQQWRQDCVPKNIKTFVKTR